MTAADVTVAHSHGVKILPYFFNFPCGETTGAGNGASYAQMAIAAAQKIGMPTGVAIFVDIEPNSTDCPSNVDRGFVKAWFDTLNPSGYLAGYYVDAQGTQFNSAYCGAVAAEPAIGTSSFIQSFTPQVGISRKPGPSPFAPNLTSCASQVYAWQYGINNPSPNIDTDEAKLALPLW